MAGTALCLKPVNLAIVDTLKEVFLNTIAAVHPELIREVEGSTASGNFNHELRCALDITLLPRAAVTPEAENGMGLRFITPTNRRRHTQCNCFVKTQPTMIAVWGWLWLT